jgi:hypothetical protein
MAPAKPNPTELPKIGRFDERLSNQIKKRWRSLALYREQSEHQASM